MDTKGVTLITGASGGIGLELARLFAAAGHDLVLVARSRDKLSALAEELAARHRVEVKAIARDLAGGSAASEIAGEVESAGLHVEILVNNAGVGLFGPFHENDAGRQLDMLRLNVVAPTDLLRLVLPGMVKRGHGRILNIASTAAFQPGPQMAVYYASKAYLLHLSEAIGEELRGTGVTVTALCPGPTHTGFEAQADLGSSRLFKVLPVMDAGRVARAGFDGLMRGRSVVIPGALNFLIVQSLRLTPRRLVTRIAGMIQAKASG